MDQFDTNIGRLETSMRTEIMLESIDMMEALESADSSLEYTYIVEASAENISKSIKNGFSKLIEMLKAFVKRTKEVIAKKFHDSKLKHQISKMRKIIKKNRLAGCKHAGGAGKYACSADYVKDYVEYAEKLYRMSVEAYKSSDTLEEAQKKFDDGKKKLDDDYGKMLGCRPDEIYSLMIMDALNMSEKDLEEVEKLAEMVDRHAEDLIHEMERLSKKEAEATAVSENVEDMFENVVDRAGEVASNAKDKAKRISKSPVLTKAATIIATIAKKVITTIMKHAASIAVLCSHRFAQWFDPDAYDKVKKEYFDNGGIHVEESTKKRYLTKENFA